MKKYGKMLCLILMTLCLITSGTTCFATQSRVDNYSKNYTLSGSGADNMVAVAKAQLGKTKKQLGYSEAWCADFVSDCARLAGESVSIPAHGYCQTLYNYVKKAGGTPVSKPQKGDLVFYVCSASSCKSVPWVHVGLMIDSKTSIEGNYDGKVSRVTGSYTDSHGHKLSSGTITRKYIRPNYSSGSKTEYDPEGVVDYIQSGDDSQTISVQGWVFDWDDSSKSLDVHIYIGGPVGSSKAEGHSITANKSRSDVNSVYGISGKHGFSATIKTSLSGKQPVYVYALNIGSGSNNPLIGSAEVNISKTKSVNIRPAMRVWFSDAKMGREIESIKVGQQIYLCYEIIDKNNGDKRLNNSYKDAYSVEEAIWQNGSKAASYTYDRSDYNWIAWTPGQAGNITGKVAAFGNTLEATLSVQASTDHIGMSTWITDEKGTPVGSLMQGKTYYLCYRIYQTTTNLTLNQIADINYDVNLTVTSPDGSVCSSQTCAKADSGNVAFVPMKGGTYTGTAVIPQLNNASARSSASLTISDIAASSYFGDVNYDGYITMEDIDVVNAYMQGNPLSEDQMKRADVNGDGAVDTTDILIINKYRLKKIFKFPAEIL